MNARLLEQYARLDDAAGYIDQSDRTRITITGGDRATYLHNLSTNDVKRLQPGQGCEAFLTSVQGKVLGHGNVFREPDRLVLDTVAGQADKLLPHLDRYLITEDVQLTDASDATCQFLLVGARAAQTLSRFVDVSALEPLYSHAASRIGDGSITVARVPWCQSGSFLLTSDSSRATDLSEMLQSAEAVNCDADVIDAVRIESGYPLYGRDITDKNLPQEVARNELAISFTKGCYLGQETVARIDALGHVNRILTGIRTDADSPPAPGTEVFHDGKSVGAVTSSTFSPRLNSPLAMAYVRCDHAEVGTDLRVDGRNAKVVKLPL